MSPEPTSKDSNEATTRHKMRLTNVQVTGLFGIFKHEISLTNDDRVTLIHGPNGVGKTMLLKMITGLIKGNASIFERVPFNEFSASRDDGWRIHIQQEKPKSSSEKGQVAAIAVTVYDQNGCPQDTPHDADRIEVPKRILDAVDQHVPGPYTRFRDGWQIRGNSRLYSLGDILTMFPEITERVPKEYRRNPFFLFAGTLDVFFVETKRLDAERKVRNRPFDDHFSFDDDEGSTPSDTLRVHQYSRDVAARIQAALANYGKNSQESDRTFPERLVKFIREDEATLPASQILSEIEELEKKRQRLIKLGFLDSETGLRDLSEDDVRKAAEALTIYVRDVKQKLAVFDELAGKVGRLIDILNDRFRYKSLSLNRSRGFILETTTGLPIDLEDLSSGEQHELVLLYELLFRVPQNGLVLVDEPEISLHVAWQSKFLSDLMAILQLTGSYGVVATHAPVIVGSRWDLTVELKGPAEDKRMEIA